MLNCLGDILLNEVPTYKTGSFAPEWDLTNNDFGKVDFTGFPIEDATISIDVDTVCLDSIYCYNSFSIDRTVALCGDTNGVN